MKTMKRKTRLVICLLLILCCGFALVLKAESGKKEMIVGFAPNPFVTQLSIGGKGMADMRELFQMGADEFMKLYGITITLKFYPSPKFLYKAFQNKEADFASLFLPVYLCAKNMGLPIKPLLTYGISDKKGQVCIYVHKDSGIKNVKQLQGKKFAATYPVFLSKKDMLPPKESYIYWIMLRKILLKNGMNKPYKNVFKEFGVLPVPWESAGYSVLLKRFDAFQAARSEVELLKNYDKGFSELLPLSCIDTPAGPPFVYRKDVSPEVVKNITELLLHPPTKSAQKVKKAFKGVKLFLVSEKDFDVYFQWLKEAEKKGWNKEFDEIMKSVPRPKK